MGDHWRAIAPDAIRTGGEGNVRIYLIPERISLPQWNSEPPEHYLNARLSEGPYDFRAEKIVDLQFEKQVNFDIEGITPGTYRLKVIWDKTAPYCADQEILCQPSVGDMVSLSSPVINIVKGAILDGVQINCDSLVK
jgi:hypothetical protein